jgi:hypothetical protein
VLHLSATVSPSQDAAFMLGIGWTTFNLVMSGFFIPYKVRRVTQQCAGTCSSRNTLAACTMRDKCWQQHVPKVIPYKSHLHATLCAEAASTVLGMIPFAAL